MHLNYHFLKHLVSELHPLLTGRAISECYSQNKDELIIAISDSTGPIRYIRAQLSGSFTCLTFPEAHHRAKKNSIDLFPQFIGRRLLDIQMTHNDRSFVIELSESFRLLFKLHGNRSNIILYEHEAFAGMFNNNLKKDETVQPDALAKNTVITRERWLSEPDIKSSFPTFGPRVIQYLMEQGFEKCTPAEQWTKINDLLVQFEAPTFYINQDLGIPCLTLFPIGVPLSSHTSAIEATNALSKHYHQTYLFEKDQQHYLQLLGSEERKALKYIDHTRQKIAKLSQKRPYDELANIIMANLHAIPKGASQVELLDFYHNKTITIKLKPDQPPQKLAEQYYRKSKNQSKERDNLEANLSKKLHDISKIKKLSQELQEITGRKQLNQFIAEHFAEKSKASNQARLPFYIHDIDGFEIRVGKSAKDNDLMLRQFTHKDDLWLHARDVAGSHVIIRHQKQKTISPDLIEKVAQLAAFYSKRKHDTLAPVIYTPRKYVRKAKNLLPGQVLVEKEQVIIVRPEKP